MADASSDEDRFSELRAERDQLRAELDHLTARTDRRLLWRRTAAGVLVVLACLSLLAAVPGVWARRNFLDTDRFVERVGPVVDDPAVQEALADRITLQLMQLIDVRGLFEEALPERGQILAVPLSNAVAGFVNDRVEQFVGSERFEELWIRAVTIAHENAVRVLRGESQIVTAGDRQVTLNLIPMIDTILAEITAETPEILGREVQLPDVSVEDLPEVVVARIEEALGVELDEDFGQVTVYDDGQLQAVQEGVRLFDRLALLLLPMAVVFAGLALWVSPRRRRTVLYLAAGAAIVAVVVRRAVFLVDDDIAALPPTEQGRAAAAAVVDAFLTPLTTFAAWLFIAALAVVAVTLLTGPSPRALAARRRLAAVGGTAASILTDRVSDETSEAWVAEHRDGLVLGGVVLGLALLWAVDLSWLWLLVVGATVGVYVGGVLRIAGSRSSDREQILDPDTAHPQPSA